MNEPPLWVEWLAVVTLAAFGYTLVVFLFLEGGLH